jgi:histidinol phosphatase-like enzyme
MVKKAESETAKGSKFKDGWYVGDSLIDLKFADRMGAKPVLIKSGNYQQTLEQLEKFTYRELKRKTKIYNNLLDFANIL